MKIALLGSGKTGSHIASLHGEVNIFNSKNAPTIENLKSYGPDAIISFLPGDVFLEYIPLLLQIDKPVICGSTGFTWPSDIDETLIKKNLTWVRSHNFSLGMNIIKSMIEKLSLIEKLYPNANFSIHESHHTKKLDAPSGTALSFKDWLNTKSDPTITSHRSGDIIGEHTIEMNSHFESITLNHTANDRALFAKGALWAAEVVTNKNEMTQTGLINFDSLVKKHLGI